ncbi:MAG: endolytic transglycosylase MltG, partial [Clostridia bacterium]|nr:endolytic transglycosylase MltG [Clostridia bacterium]
CRKVGYIVNNQDKPNNIDRNERTRQIPVQKPAAQNPSTQTRQIPVQKPAAQNPSTQTRQIPVQKPAAQNPSTQTRQIPVQKPAAQNPSTQTRQNPVQKPTVQNPSSQTRQIPVQKPAAQSEIKSETKKIPIPVKKEGSAEAVDSRTRQIPINNEPSRDEENSGTRMMDKTSADTDITKKKKKRSPFNKKEDEDDGNLLVSVIKAVIYIVAVLVVSITASIFIIMVGNDVFAFVKSDEVVEVTIPEGADVADIASILHDSGIIKYPNIFKMYVDDDGKGFIPGKYSVPMNLDYDDLLASFKEQRDEGTTWVTIPEGYTTDEIIALLVEKGIGTKEGYVDVINNYAFDYWFVHEIDATDWKAEGRIYRLDGYLFPDTYEFYNESSERAVIEKLLARFNVIFGKKYREAAETMGMSVDDLVIIASMIEKEAGKAADYHLVSSVFHNRLKSQYFPKMESDATVLYAIHHDTGERPTDVTGEHMQYETPYNTYKYEGLPPGPIANPSASSINAALTPENTGYYYFVSDGFNTYFGRNNDEHERNKAMVAALKNGNTEE